MRLFRPFFLLRLLYPEAIFRIKTGKKELCLTFDDGPSPDSTPQILDILEANSVRALFFCSGKEAEKYPSLISLIGAKGHITGNHGYSHLNGYITNTQVYIRNISRGAKFTPGNIMRPPYGRIRPSQYSELSKNYRVFFWDLMPYDFDTRMTSFEVMNILKKRIRNGSVIVLHDKPSSSVLSFLDEFIKYAKDNGYRFVIPPF